MHYIFEVYLKPGYSAEQYADVWRRASAIIQRAPGARGTRLHRRIGDPERLLAIATWDSKAARDEMEGNAPEEVAAIIAEAAPHVTITPIGEFEEPEWEVLPPD
ncbi:antibiotic biosynthesis monooxygenase family protein [Kineobactrum salinum]|uniref:Antibiotic biosynthesis monooxygenase n=1 Tax=Kineobactrum salinum TaxID=2708301 RepID=A0A6C0TXN0_9GAMM|nr:antibiotic biosynthesis monooxygenase [Kineobactrum salinum]QIB64159.1 antibiotic biosynthesis monooxygenase [Kineobactrum salinum]